METLLEALKRKLKITWEDEDTDKRLDEILSNAVPIIGFKLGIPAADSEEAFAKAGPERNLLINYCMYEWNNCVYEFDRNYKNDLLQCRVKYEVEQNEDE